MGSQPMPSKTIAYRYRLLRREEKAAPGSPRCEPKSEVALLPAGINEALRLVGPGTTP